MANEDFNQKILNLITQIEKEEHQAKIEAEEKRKIINEIKTLQNNVREKGLIAINMLTEQIQNDTSITEKKKLEYLKILDKLRNQAKDEFK